MIDLHTHSNCSDGLVSPEQLLDKAKEAGLYAVALTDHDTVIGLDRAKKRASEIGMVFVPGVEVSADEPVHVHLLGLNIDYKNKKLANMLSRGILMREERNAGMVAKLRAAGYDVDAEKLRSRGGEGVTRANIARELVKGGYAKNIDDAFGRYLAKGCVGYLKGEKLKAKEIIETILYCGGVPVLCHINQIKLPKEELEALIKKYVLLGLCGVETIYPEYDEYWKNYAKEVCEKYGLIGSGGSDFHGDERRSRVGSIDVPDEILTAILKKSALK